MKNNLKFKIQNSKLWTTIFIFFLMPGLLLAAGSYPQPVNKYVNDFAGILTATDRNTMSETLKSLEQRAGVVMTVVTIKTMADYGTGETDIEAFAAGVFKEWKTGLENGNKGILMLVSTGDRKIKIETGSYFGEAYQEKMLAIIETKIIPFFKQDAYGRGIYEGVREIVKKTEKKPGLPDLNMNYILAALAFVFLIVLAVIFSGKKTKSGSGKADEKPAETVKTKIKPAVKTEKLKRELSVFGGGAAGSW